MDELVAQEVSNERQRQQNLSLDDVLEAQLESHTTHGVPGTAALMQYNVIRGLQYEPGLNEGPADEDNADAYFVGLVLDISDGCLYKTEDLSCDWVVSNFEKSFIRAVKRQALDKDGGFFGPGSYGLTPVDPSSQQSNDGIIDNAPSFFLKLIPYSGVGEQDSTTLTSFVVKKLRYMFTGVPLEAGNILQDSSTLEIHKAQFEFTRKFNSAPTSQQGLRGWIGSGLMRSLEILRRFQWTTSYKKTTTRHIDKTLVDTHVTLCHLICFRLR